MKKYVLLASSIFLIFLSIIMVFNKRIAPSIDNKKFKEELALSQQKAVENAAKAEKEKEEQKKLAIEKAYASIDEVPKNDGQRVGMYIGNYITMVNSKKYEEAYDVLEQSFKDLNFPTLDSYKEYMQKKYQRLKVLEYLNFKLENNVYVVETNVSDMGLYDNPETFKQIFMFKELEPGKYVLSFGIE